MGGPRVLDDRYELLERIGTGGMAEVWRAHDRRLGRDVAVKLISGPGTEGASRRIEREARALAAADHPNIVAVYDHGEAVSSTGEPTPYIVMELVDGPDLGRFVAERGPLPVDEVRRIMAGVLAAIERAHASGVVHGDLKPANVFVGSHGPKVGDFGVSRILGSETGQTTLAATPSFAPPEVLRGERATPASDIYSAACLAYELLTGHAPYEGGSGWEVAQKHLEAPAPHVRRERPDVPASVDTAIQRALDKRPRKRFASASEFGSAIGVRAEVPTASDGGATVPVAVADPIPDDVTLPARDATEVIGSPRPDAARLALLGPLDAVWSRVRRRMTGARPGLVAAVVAVVLVLLLGSVLLRDRGPALVVVPDVTGHSVAAATKTLTAQGFTVTDVSFRPVVDTPPGRVVETIPGPQATAASGSDVHLVVGVAVATPSPSPAPVVEHPRRPKPRHKHGKD